MSDERRKDYMTEEKLREVLQQELGPIKDFMADVTAARKAAIWVIAIFAAMGAALKWCLDVKNDLHHG